MVLSQQCKCDIVDSCANVTRSRQKTQLLWITVALLALFFVAEWSVGLWSHSLSLQADAGHILSDVAALGLSLFATWLAQQPATGKATFGHHRVEILAALVNGLTLLAIALVISWEAIHRFQTPETILDLPMLAIACLGLIVNLLNITLLHPHSHDDLNLRGAFIHVIADTVSSLGVILAAIAIHLWDWLWADAAISLVVAVLTGLSALPLLRESLNILLEYAPKSIEPIEVQNYLESIAGVVEVEKLYIWRISQGKVMLSANLIVDCARTSERDRLLKELQNHLRENFGIGETTLQLTSRVVIHPLFNQNLVSMVDEGKVKIGTNLT
jgi:cobalt-zinc-cadmium efflux system protein